MHMRTGKRSSRAVVPAPALALALALTLASGLGAAPGEPTEEQTRLPAAETILDGFVAATGGRAAYDKIHNRVTKATFELVDAGLSGSLSIYAAKPDKIYTVLEAEALGKREGGTDGETVWEISTMAGPIVKEGPEKAQTLKDAQFDRIIYWRDNFDSVETVGLEDVGDRPCYEVVQTAKTGAVETYFYDRETHMMAKMSATVQTPMGEVPLEVYPADFKEVDGVLLPHFVTIKVLGQTRTLRTDSVEQNVELPDDRFDLPAGIRSLVEKDAAPSGGGAP